jgi:DNA cross-link repair 1A protein
LAFLNPVGSKSKGFEALRPSERGGIAIFDLPYSEHSSYTELRDFVRAIRPMKITPTVNVGSPKERARMDVYFAQWLAGKKFVN